VGLGCNNFGQRTDLETSRKVIHKAIDLGVTLFDTADIYAGMGGSETVLGQVLGERRKDIVLATKFSKAMSNDGTKQGASRRDIEKDLLPAAQQYNLGLLPFFPLASGLLTGKYQRGAAAPADTRFAKAPALRERYATPRNEEIVDKLQAFAQARGHTLLELAF